MEIKPTREQRITWAIEQIVGLDFRNSIGMDRLEAIIRGLTPIDTRTPTPDKLRDALAAAQKVVESMCIFRPSCQCIGCQEKWELKLKLQALSAEPEKKQMEYGEFMRACMNWQNPAEETQCMSCGDLGLMPKMCCGGRECGCRGMPVDFIECWCGNQNYKAITEPAESKTESADAKIVPPSQSRGE